MRRWVLIGFAIAFFTGCKKELKGEFSILVGEWECESLIEGSSIVPAITGGFSHTLLFQKDGTYKIINKQSGEKSEKGRITKINFDYYKCCPRNRIVLINRFQDKKYLKGEYKWDIYMENSGVERLYLEDGYIGWKNPNTGETYDTGNITYKRNF